MKRFTPKQRAEIVTLYIENSRSVVLTQRAYRRKYRGQEAPSDNTIRRLVSNFVEHGTVADRQHAIHQRPRRSNELIEAVRESVAENPHMSYRNRAQHFGVSGTTLRRILKDEEKKQHISYKITEKPKRPLSAYMLWLNSARDGIKRENPGIKVTEVAKRGGELWRALKDKSEWEAKAAKAKGDYEAALREFEANGCSSAANGNTKKGRIVIKKPAKKSKKAASDDVNDDDESE